jgi:hypothetical protein
VMSLIIPNEAMSREKPGYLTVARAARMESWSGVGMVWN